MSATSVISWMLARSPRPSAISRTAASMRAWRVRALRRSSRDTLGALAAGTASAITAPPAIPSSTLVPTPSEACPQPARRPSPALHHEHGLGSGRDLFPHGGVHGVPSAAQLDALHEHPAPVDEVEQAE